jgi:Ca2+-binding RTX toxin-like protein
MEVTGMQDGYTVVTFTATGYDRIEVLNDSGGGTHKFSLSNLEVLTVNTGAPVDMQFNVTLTDNDGDTVASLLNVTLEPTALNGNDNLTGDANANTLYGGAGSDTIDGAGGNDILVGGSGGDSLVGGLGNDTIMGGLGNDTMTGGDGNDTLKWGAGDHGTGSPAIDTITDFGTSGTDVLDLAELLQGEHADAGSLVSYLSFESTNAGLDTTIHVKSMGAGGVEDLQIVLQGVTLGSLGPDNSTIITNLLGAGKLHTDA